LHTVYGVTGYQLRPVQLYINSLPLHTVLKFYCVSINFLLACSCVKNGVLELFTTVPGAKELDDCDSLLPICRLAYA